MGIVWFSDYENPLGLYSHKPRIYPQGLSEKLCGRACKQTWVSRERAGLSEDLGPSRKQGASEDEVEAEADAALGDARIGRVGEASDVVDLKHLEDVVHTHDHFEVGLVGHDV